MFRRGLLPLTLMVLFVIGLLSVGAYAVWSQAYASGLAAGAAAAGNVVPYAPHFVGFSPFFFGLMFFFKIALLLLLFLVIIKIFRFWSWRRAGGPQGGPWGGHRHWRHGGGSRESEEGPSRDKPEQAGPNDEPRGR